VMRDGDDTHPLARLPFPQSGEQWQESPAKQSTEELSIMGHPVMQRWEAPYMKELARIATSEGGKVLEIGYGMGLSAGFIQANGVAEHWIIEANRDVFASLKDWARRQPARIQAINGFWEEVTPQLEADSFDGILFDPYPINLDQLHEQRFSFFAEARRLLRAGGVFTHYAGETEFTPEYRRRLEAAGFSDYEGALVEVSPPPDCLYWTERRILAPLIRKDG
jgi:guanidinoacetate N-methyltransferase